MAQLHNPAATDRLDRALLAELTADPTRELDEVVGRWTLSEERINRGEVEVVKIVQLTRNLQRRTKHRIISSGRRPSIA